MRPRRGGRIITDTTWLKRLTTLAAAAIGCAAPLMAAAYAGLPAAVAQQLKSAGIAPTAVAAFAQEVGSDRPILSYNADMPMNPASVMKLVTTFAALELLGPTYTWRTELLGRRAAGDVLEGDLFLRGSGDPKLTLEGFWALLRSLRARGIREIRGDLVLDRARFESVEFDPAKFDNEPLRAYNVGPDAVLVNFKVVRFTFLPDGATGTVSVVAEPRLPQVDMVANVRATPGACGDWRAGLAADIQAGSASARIRFAGSIPASCGERTWFVSLLSPQQYTYGLFQSLWSEMGGTLAGGWREGAPPADARLLASTDSPPLVELVRDINKLSNNVMSRQVFLTLSAELLRLPGRTDRSARAVRSWLQQKNLDLPELVMENGSGLSRIERISAAGMGQLLLAAFRSPVMPEFVSSLPLAAYDGTMRRRPRLESMSGQAHVKTGSLVDVRSVAGYVLDRTGRRYVVAFFVNHAAAGQSQPAQDAFLQWVHDRGRGAGASTPSMSSTPSIDSATPAAQ